MADAYGLEDSDTIPICVPPGTASGATYCSTQTCNGAAGCLLAIHVGTVDWTLAPRTSVSSDVTLDATVTQVDGIIQVTGAANCTLSLVIQEDSPLPAEALGTLEPAAAGDGALKLSFHDAVIDTSDAVVNFTPKNNFMCTLIAAAALDMAGPQIDAALLEALEARAEPLTCLECRSDCPEEVACIADASGA